MIFGPDALNCVCFRRRKIWVKSEKIWCPMQSCSSAARHSECIQSFPMLLLDVRNPYRMKSVTTVSRTISNVDLRSKTKGNSVIQSSGRGTPPGFGASRGAFMASVDRFRDDLAPSNRILGESSWIVGVAKYHKHGPNRRFDASRELAEKSWQYLNKILHNLLQAADIPG